MTSADVVAALKKTYAAPAWAFLEQVGNATGFGTDRHADGIAMSLWPSRGLTLHGFEVKVSRSDWKRELVNPDKAEPIAEYCDFWIVAAPKGIVPSLDVPTAWGLIEVDDKGRTRTLKKAEQLKAKPLDRGFLAAILRQASEHSPTWAMRTEARREALDAAVKHVEYLVAEKTGPLRRELEDLRERVRTFEAELGIPLEGVSGRYGFAVDGADLAKIVRFLAANNPRELLGEANQIQRIAERLLEMAGELRDNVPADIGAIA